jgi:hypothetical protein
LPSQESLEESGKENSGTAAENLKWYQQIRKRLIIEYGMLYVDRNGKIKDYVLVALILAMEFKGVRDYDYSFYDAGLSAVSQQYHTTRFQYPSSSAACYGSCTTEEQLIWLQGMHAVRTSLGSETNLFQSDKSSGLYWEGFIDDARRATATPLHAQDGNRYWGWGDNPSGRGDILKSNDKWIFNQTGYFEVYGYSNGWK